MGISLVSAKFGILGDMNTFPRTIPSALPTHRHIAHTVLNGQLIPWHGQQVSLFTQNPEALGTLVDVFVQQVGRVNINAQCQRGPDTFPFNGRKDSAEGTLSVYDALRAFSIRSLVTFASQGEQKALVSEVLSHRSSQFLSTDFYL